MLHLAGVHGLAKSSRPCKNGRITHQHNPIVRFLFLIILHSVIIITIIIIIVIVIVVIVVTVMNIVIAVMIIHNTVTATYRY